MRTENTSSRLTRFFLHLARLLLFTPPLPATLILFCFVIPWITIALGSHSFIPSLLLSSRLSARTAPPPPLSSQIPPPSQPKKPSNQCGIVFAPCSSTSWRTVFHSPRLPPWYSVLICCHWESYEANCAGGDRCGWWFAYSHLKCWHLQFSGLTLKLATCLISISVTVCN